MIAVSTSPFNLSMLRKFNVWYSVKDGNFNDPEVWISNGKKKHGYPQPGDDIYISHNVTFNIIGGILNLPLRNVYVSPCGKLLFNSGGGTTTYAVMGDLQVDGTLDMTGAGGIELDLYGVSNYINTFIGGSGRIGYNRAGDQDIMNLPYNNLVIAGSGNKNIFGALTINGTTVISGAAIVTKKTAAGKLTFGGQLSNLGADKSGLDNTINADIEFRGGIGLDMRGTNINLGTGNIYFNGSQSIQFGGGAQYHNYNNCLIMGSSVLTILEDGPHQSPFVAHGIWNGETAASTLNIDGIFWQANNTEPMATGIYNYKHGVNSEVGFVFNGDYTLPYTNYAYLTIRGSGTKILSGNTVLTKNLTVGGALELAAFDFTVGGTTNTEGGQLAKNSGGYVTFIGSISTGGSSVFAFNSPCTVEMRNGLAYDQPGSVPVFAAGVLLKFTTNDQNINNGHSSAARWGCDILISGAITVINQLWGFGISGTLNGDNAASTFKNLGLFSYKNAQQPMQTGLLISDTASVNNQFIYERAGDQDIRPGTYSNLTLAGSGARKLLGDVSVTSTYILTPPATLDANGFVLSNP